MTTSYDVVCMGNAIVDLVCRCDEAAITRAGAVKAHMILVDNPARIDEPYRRFGNGMELAGGSATNTAVAIASLGGRPAFIGRVSNDDLGRLFEHDIRSMGVAFAGSHAEDGKKATSRSLILITPDGQRTMMTYLGSSADLDSASVSSEVIKNSKILMLEGYLFDKRSSRLAMYRAVEIARGAGIRVALSLPDSLCIERHKQAFREMVRTSVNILIASESEAMSLYDANHFEEAVHCAAAEVAFAAITRGHRGSVVVKAGATVQIPAEPVSKVIDRTGAADLYAAGLLYGLAHGMTGEASARLGAFAAADIIGQLGARPQVNLAKLARMRGLIGVKKR